MANNIKKYRELSGYSQKELADKIGVCKATIGHWETNRRKLTTVSLDLISKALNVPITDLIDNEPVIHLYENKLKETILELYNNNLLNPDSTFNDLSEPVKNELISSLMSYIKEVLK